MNYHYLATTDRDLSPTIFDTADDTYIDLSIFPGSRIVDNSWDTEPSVPDFSTVNIIADCDDSYSVNNDMLLLLLLVIVLIVVCGYFMLRTSYRQVAQQQDDRKQDIMRRIR